MCALEDRLSSQIDPNCQLYRMTTRDATMWLQRSLFGGLGALCVKMGFKWTFSYETKYNSRTQVTSQVLGNTHQILAFIAEYSHQVKELLCFRAKTTKM